MKKIKVKWIGGICLLLFLIAFFTSPLFVISLVDLDVNDYGFFESIKNTWMEFDDEIGIFWLSLYFLFPVIIFLFSSYKTEKRIAIGDFSFKRLIIFNSIITFILYGVLFFPIMFLYALSAAFGEHGGSDYLIKFLIIAPLLLVVFFSVAPSLFLLKFNIKPKVLSLTLWFFFFITIILFLNTFQYVRTCGNYEYPLCLAEKAIKDKNHLLCDKAKDDLDDELFSARDSCYAQLSEDWNDLNICNTSSDSYGRCVTNVAINTNKQQLCDLIKINDEKIECYSMFNPSIGSCETNDDNCVAKKAKKWQDYSLCDKLSDNKDKNHCYVSLSYDWKDIKLCDQIVGSDNSSENNRYECITNVSINSNNPQFCEKFESKHKESCLVRFKAYFKESEQE